MDLSNLTWKPLLVEEPFILMRYYAVKIKAKFVSDGEFLLYLLNLLDSKDNETTADSEVVSNPTIDQEVDEEPGNLVPSADEQTKSIMTDDSNFVKSESNAASDGQRKVELKIVESVMCHLCKEGPFLREKTLQKHFRKKHQQPKPGKKIRKYKLDKVEEEPSEWMQKNECKKFPCYACDPLNTEFETSTELLKHFDRQHPDVNPFRCKACGRCFPELSDLNIHKKKAQHRGIFECEFCQKVFWDKFKLNSHMRRHTGNMFKCDLCDKEFTLKRYLKTHKENVHEKIRRFVCEMCGKGFTNLVYYRDHKATHQGAEYKCTMCDKQFLSSTTLKGHMKTVHSNMPKQCKCEECGKFFKTPGEVKIHSRMHDRTRTKNFPCDKCEKAFYIKSQLSHHLRMHNNERNYVCEVCRKAFLSSGILKNHMRTHTGERPYKCPLCPSEFGHSAALYTHAKTKHEGYKVPLKQTKDGPPGPAIPVAIRNLPHAEPKVPKKPKAPKKDQHIEPLGVVPQPPRPSEDDIQSYLWKVRTENTGWNPYGRDPGFV